ncbi:DNA alkylation repair protein [Streptomyces sp. NPDC001178]
MSVTGADILDVPFSTLADTVLERLTATYAAAADPKRAESMRAYMKDVAPFLGLSTPVRRSLSRTVVAGLPRPDEGDCTAIALRCWQLPEREYHYFAVDALAAHVVGALVAADPRLTADMDAWIADDDLWVVRTALLHQLRHKERTDAERLFAYCVRQSGHPDFFIRKAIGWCLREYAKTDPEAVRAFLARERGRFAPLSVREALKNIGP